MEEVESEEHREKREEDEFVRSICKVTGVSRTTLKARAKELWQAVMPNLLR